MRTGDTTQGIFGENLNVELTPVVQLKFPYNIDSTEVATTLVSSGTVTQADSQAVVSSGAASSSSATLTSRRPVNYQPGQGVLARFTCVFTQGVEGNTQLIGLGDSNDGFFIGYNGTDFGALRRQNGTDYWSTGNSLNGELSKRGFTSTGALDPTKGNIYQIEYQWLGYGNIIFSAYDSRKESYVVLHKIEYANLNVVPTVYNPSFTFMAQSSNTTNDTDITIKTPSVGVFIEGQEKVNSLPFAAESTKTVTTEVNVLTIRNNTTFQSINNRSLIIPQQISIASDGTKSVSVKMYLNTTLGGTPSYSEVDSDRSTVSSDTAGTTVTGGRLLGSFSLAKTDSLVLEDINVDLVGGDTLTITASSSSSNDVSVAIVWKELK